MCSKTAAWCSTVKPRRWARTRTSRSSISASPKAGANRSARASITGGASAGWRSSAAASPPSAASAEEGARPACDLMGDRHYDSLETRDPDDRERDFFGRLPDFIALALSAPGWASQLAGVDPNAVTSRAALAKLPVLHKSELATRQKERPPLGGFNVAASDRLRRLLMSPGPTFEPQGAGEDFWGAARAVFAAGFRAGDVVHNSFSYPLPPGGLRRGAGAHALGCTVTPAGTGHTEQQLEAIAHFRPSGYLGTPDFLKILLDAAAKAGTAASSLRRALVSGAALPRSLRQELAARGVEVCQCYATADAGVIAYESEAREGMIVNETLLVEIVRPGTGDPVAAGEVG